MKQKTGRRLLSFLLTLAMIVGLMPGMSLTAYAATSYNLWVGSTEVTSEKKEGDNWSYDDTNNILTLNNYSGTDGKQIKPSQYTTNNYYCGICYTGVDPLTIQLVGNNTISLGDGSNGYHESGIFIYEAQLNIVGSAKSDSLSIITGKATGGNGNYCYNYGICVNQSGDLLINNCTLEVNAGAAEGGKRDSFSYGLYAGRNKIIIDNNSTVTAKGNTSAVIGTVKTSATCLGWKSTVLDGEGDSIATSATTEISIDGSYKAIQLTPPSHTHSFSYSASGATITAACSNTDENCTLDDGTTQHNHTATLTIDAAGGAYDGTTAFSATVTNNIPTVEGDTVGSIEYYKVNTEGATTGGTVQASAPVNAGYYYARVTLTSGSDSYTAVKAFTIAKGTAEALDENTARTNSGINYQTEQATPSSGYQISTDNANPVASTPVSLTGILDGNTPTIYVRRTENDNQNAGDWVEVILTARPSAPTAPSTENATNDSTADGKIKGALATWEYKNKETGKDPTNWTTMTAGDVTVKSGTYQIRVKATDSVPHGKVTEVTVGSKYVALTEANKPTISVSNGHNPPVIGDTLTATTTATDILYQWYRGGTPITVATGATYTLTADDVGKAISVKVIQKKKPDGSDYGEGVRPAQSSAATSNVVKKAPASMHADTAKDNIIIRYGQETVTPQAGYEVSVNGTSPATSPVRLTEVLSGEGTPKIYVRTAETEDTAAGDWVAVTLTARPAAPTGLTTEEATNGSTANGKISGVDTTMEYSADGTSWTDVTGGAIEGLTPGTYQVRIKATADVPHGRATEVTVGSKQIILTDSQKPTAKTSLTYNGTEQLLINEPSAALPQGAVGLQYALGTDASTAPHPAGEHLSRQPPLPEPTRSGTTQRAMVPTQRIPKRNALPSRSHPVLW